MKIFFLSIFSLILNVTVSFSQDEAVTFSKTFAVYTSAIINHGQSASRPIEIEDGYIFSTNAVGLSFLAGSKIALFKTDLEGNELWRWEDSTFTAYYLNGNIFLYDSHIYLNYSKTVQLEGGNLGAVILNKFNLSGDLIWSIDFEDSEDVPYKNHMRDITVYNNKIYISYSSAFFSGIPPPNHIENDVALMCLDTTGNLLWVKEYDSGGNIDYNYSLLVGADSAIYLTGITNGLGASGWRGHLIKTDMEGNMIWQKLYPEIDGNGGMMTINYLKDEKFILTGHNYNSNQQLVRGKILIIDTSGIINQSLTFIDDNPDGIALYRSSQISDNNLVSVGISRIENSDCGLIQKSTTNGGFIWRHRYDYNERTDFFIDFAETQDKGFIITGAASYGGQSTGQDTWLLKLDSNGCLMPGCLEVGIEEAEQEMGITLYPNPTTDRLFIKTEQSQKRPLKFSLYNMQGKLIIQEHLVAEYESFDLSSLSTGVYLVHIIDNNGKKVSRKIVKN